MVSVYNIERGSINEVCGGNVIKLSFSRRAWNACEILYHSRSSEHVKYMYT